MPDQVRLGFIGAGKMATALAKGFIRGAVVQPKDIIASDPSESACDEFRHQTGGEITRVNEDVASRSHVLILAVKPAQVADVLAAISHRLTREHLVISIAAGVPLSRLEGALPPQARVIRVMPNTAALAGASATAFSIGGSASADDAALAERLFSTIGVTIQVKESLLDAVTGLSGSGPAYVCMMIEALSDGGVAAGLPRELATRLAAQTLLGTAKMVLETGLHPGELKDMVTSPGGTTIEGLHELEKGGLRAALINAVRAAAEKSKRLGQ